MLNIESILAMWKEDCQIKQFALDETTIEGARLHAKYLEFFTTSKLRLKQLEFLREKLKLAKWLYFSGKMTKEEMDKRGWPYDPFDGANKPLKSDMSYYFNADEDLQTSDAKITYQNELVKTLEEILNVLRWRHQLVKNILESRKFEAGA